MTKEEFFKEHQNNKELINELDDIISVFKIVSTKFRTLVIHMKQMEQNLYTYNEDKSKQAVVKDLLSILGDIGIVDMFSIKHKDEDSTHKNQNKSEIFQNFTRTIKLLEKRTTTKSLNQVLLRITLVQS